MQNVMYKFKRLFHVTKTANIGDVDVVCFSLQEMAWIRGEPLSHRAVRSRQRPQLLQSDGLTVRPI